MKLLRTYLVTALLALLPLGASAGDTYIWVNVSMKLIVNPTNHVVPSSFDGNLATQWLAQANAYLANHWRGYRLRWSEPFIPCGYGNSSPTDPGYYYEPDIKNVGAGYRAGFDQQAITNASYYWRANAVNIYMNKDSWSSTTRDTIATGYAMFGDPKQLSSVFFGSANWPHEIGHYFGLLHTFADTNCIAVADEGCKRFIWDTGPGVANDCINDTPADFGCWSARDNIASYNFGTTYYNITDPAKRQAVDRTWYNLMSYHQWEALDTITNDFGGLSADCFNTNMNVLTEDQLDRWANNANTFRRAVVSGTTIFVGPGGFDGPNNGTNGLSVASRLATVSQAVSNSAPFGGDIVLLRPGSYNERLTITNLVTLRATHAGAVTIGR